MKVACTVWSGGKSGDNLKGLPIAIKLETYEACKNTYRKYCVDRNTLVYVLNVDMAVKTAEALRECVSDPKTIQVITGSTPQETRNDILNRFKEGKVKTIVNCMVLTEGTDLPSTDCIMIIRPSVNPVLYTQIIGRGLRTYEGKDYCLVLDISPESNRTLCNPAQLLGLNIEPTEKEQDLYKLYQQEKEKQLALEKVKLARIEIEEQVYNLFAQQIEERYSFIMSAAQSSSLAEKLTKEQEKINSDLDFMGMHTVKLSTGEYKIRADATTDILITEPDMLGCCNVTVTTSQETYETKKPVRFNEIIPRIKKWLCNNLNLGASFYWNEIVVKQWRNQPPSEAQLNKIKSLEKSIKKKADENFEIFSDDILTKYEASITIDCLQRHVNDIDKKNILKKSLSKIRSTEASELQQENDKEKLDIEHLLTGISAEDTNDIENNESSDHIVSIYSDMFCGKTIPQSPQSASQSNFYQTLKREILKIASFDCEPDETVSTFTMREMSVLISLLKTLSSYSSKVQGKIICVKEILENLANNHYQNGQKIVVPLNSKPEEDMSKKFIEAGNYVVYICGQAQRDRTLGACFFEIRNEKDEPINDWKKTAVYYTNTTNNRMTLISLIRALLIIPIGSRIKVVTDSMYLAASLNLPDWKWQDNQDLFFDLSIVKQNHKIEAYILEKNVFAEKTYRFFRNHSNDADIKISEDLPKIPQKSKEDLDGYVKLEVKKCLKELLDPAGYIDVKISENQAVSEAFCRYIIRSNPEVNGKKYDLDQVYGGDIKFSVSKKTQDAIEYFKESKDIGFLISDMKNYKDEWSDVEIPEILENMSDEYAVASIILKRYKVHLKKDNKKNPLKGVPSEQLLLPMMKNYGRGLPLRYAIIKVLSSSVPRNVSRPLSLDALEREFTKISKSHEITCRRLRAIEERERAFLEKLCQESEKKVKPDTKTELQVAEIKEELI